MKHIFNKALVCVLCFLTVFCGTSCNLFSKEEPQTTEEQNTEAETEAFYELSAGVLSEYMIIYPEDQLTDTLEEKLEELQAAIKKSYGAEPEFRDDFVKEGTKYTVNRYEILVGDTNREESINALEDIHKALDYEIRLCGEKLVVGGLSEAANITALDVLIKIINEKPSKSNVFDSSMNVSYRGSYELDDIVLDGASISEYTVIYESSLGCMNLANQIVELITARTGYLITTQSVKRPIPEGRCIFVGKTTAPTPSAIKTPISEEQYYIGMEQDDLYIYGINLVAVTKAVEQFTQAVNGLTKGSAPLKLTDEVMLFTNTTLTSMSFNIYWDTSDTERKENVVTTIKKYMPDTFGVQEATSNWMTYLGNELGDTYAWVGEGRNPAGDNEYNAVFYRKDLFNLVESGTRWMSDTPEVVGSKIQGSSYPRIFTYALLELKTTGQRFLHVNTHPDHVPNTSYNGYTVRLQQVSVITSFLKKNYPDVPTILTGDLNDTEDTASLNHLKSFGFQNSAKIAIGGDTTPTFKDVVIDYALVTNGDFNVYEYKVITDRYNGSYPSDHRAIIVCYELTQ